MKRTIFAFFLGHFFLLSIIQYHITYAQQPNQTIPPIIVPLPPVPGSGEPDNKGVDVLTAEVEEVFKKHDVGCGKEGQVCCTKDILNKFKPKNTSQKISIFASLNGLINKIKGEAIETVSNNSDEILQSLPEFGIVCVNDNYPVYQDPQKPNVNECQCKTNPFKLQELCRKIGEPGKVSTERNRCELNSTHAVWTALGPIDFTLQGFIQNTLVGWGIGLAGVITLLCIIYSAFTLQISGGNPEKIKKAKERLTACVVGLLLIIFSVFILKLIGVDILQIPGFE